MRILAACLFLAISPSVAAARCGGDFSTFVRDLRTEAEARGISAETTRQFFAGVRMDPEVIRADRRQGIFQMPFTQFARRLISQNRLDRGMQKSRQLDGLFRQIEQNYGVSRGVLLAFWAFETDFGAVQGDFNTVNALVTLAHDCRRPELFRPQVFAALELFGRGDIDPVRTTGAWAGEIGMVQMLPGDIIENGVDADNDGRVRLKTSEADALASGANLLRSLGWRSGEPWLTEIVLPTDLDLRLTGLDTTRRVSEWSAMGVRARAGSLGPEALPASVLLPEGRNGPAFLAYPNYSVLFEWNQSFVYVTTAAYFATRLEGAPVFDADSPSPGLSGEEMKLLQRRLEERGHDVGGIDGILGRMTRAAVQAEQARLGLPADAWPTRDLLNRL
ncbi:MAG: lytic murein transglycosylase [Pseudomonadota bacterium]